MFGSSILEVAIGVIFIYLLLSLLCSAINELIASFMNMRGETLFAGIKNLLNDPSFTGLAQKVYNHGLVDGISQASKDPNKPNRRPSYIAANTFAMTLMDILKAQNVGKSLADVATRKKVELDTAKARFDAYPSDPGLRKAFYDAQSALGNVQNALTKVEEFKAAYDDAEMAVRTVNGPRDIANLRTAKAKFQKALTMGRLLAAELPDPLDNIQRAVSDLPDGHTREALLVFIPQAKQAALQISQANPSAYALEILQGYIERWYNDAMDRVSGWYKRWTQQVTFGIAILIVLVGNVDTVALAKNLNRNPTLRQSILEMANSASQGDDPTQNKQVRDDLLREAGNLTLPLGWVIDENDPYWTEQVPDCSGKSVSQCAGAWGMKLLGLLMSILAVHIGAPVWFDALKGVVNIRGAGIPPGEKDKDAQQATQNLVISSGSAASLIGLSSKNT